MKCLCIAGFGSAPQQFYSLLVHAGMSPPLPVIGPPLIDIHLWHRQVVELLEGVPAGERAHMPLGRMWEHLASELFLLNSEAQIWGWADELSMHVLDFWHEFDPRLMFVLLYRAPEELVASHVEQHASGELELQRLLEGWCQSVRTIINFSRSNPQRCLVLDVDEALREPVVAVEHIAAQWRLPLNFPVNPDETRSPVIPTPLAYLIAREVVQQHPSISGLMRELEKQIVRLNVRSKGSERQVGISDLLSSFASLQERSRFMESQLLAVREGYEKQISTIKYELESVRKTVAEKDHTLLALEERLSSSVEENELLLWQMHEVQEGLSTIIAQHGDLQDKKNQECEQLKASLEQALKECNEAGTELAAIRQQLKSSEVASVERDRRLSALEQRLTHSTEENELLLMQLGQAQEALETLFIRIQEQQTDALAVQGELNLRLETINREFAAQGDELAACKTKLRDLFEENNQYKEQLALVRSELLSANKRYDEMVADNLSLQARLEALARENEGQVESCRKFERQLVSARNQIVTLEQEASKVADEMAKLRRESAKKEEELFAVQKELQSRVEESELIQFQLRQVQDDLKYYFYKQQESEQLLDALNARLRKMRACYPDYVEFQSVEVISAADAYADWRLKGLVLAGEDFKELNFSTLLEHGMAGFVFHKEEAGVSEFFSGWPLKNGEHRSITLLPLGTPAQVRERSVALLSLGTSAWSRLLRLTEFLVSLLQNQPLSINAPEGFDVGAWLNALRALKADISQFPAVPRFDRLKLKREQVNPDYEHLWLAFENLSLGNTKGVSFEFRISCANVRPGSFGKFPKLEFPRGEGQSLFDSWFEESNDDFGDKLELRFALPEAMDLGVWNKLSVHDQDVLRRLIRFLPDCLRFLEQDGYRLNRPWCEWQMMVGEIVRIASIHVMPSAKSLSSRARRQIANGQIVQPNGVPGDDGLAILDLSFPSSQSSGRVESDVATIANQGSENNDRERATSRALSGSRKKPAYKR